MKVLGTQPEQQMLVLAPNCWAISPTHWQIKRFKMSKILWNISGYYSLYSWKCCLTPSTRCGSKQASQTYCIPGQPKCFILVTWFGEFSCWLCGLVNYLPTIIMGEMRPFHLSTECQWTPLLFLTRDFTWPTLTPNWLSVAMAVLELSWSSCPNSQGLE